MAAQRRKAVSVLGQAALFMAGVNWQQPAEDDVVRDFKKLLGQTQKVIGDPGPDDPRETRIICYYAMLDAIESLPTVATRLGQFRELLDYMLARGELVYGATLAASEPVHLGYRYYAPYLYRTLGRRVRWLVAAAEYDALVATARRTLEQLDKHGAVCLDGQEGRLRYRLTEACQSVFLARPELRPKTPVPWRRAVRLLSVTDYPEWRAISRVQIRGGAVWTMGLGDADSRDAAQPGERSFRGGSERIFGNADGSPILLPERPHRYGFLQPIAVALDSGQRRVLPKRGYPRDSVGAPVLPYTDNCHFDMDERTLCVGSFSQGLCLVPLQGGAADWLDYDGQLSRRCRGTSGIGTGPSRTRQVQGGPG
jgi:hypothetical protein